MTAFVLDNSVTMRWCFQNAVHPYADSVLQQLASGEAVVPVLWRYEVSAVLAKSQKDGILTAAKADAFLMTLESLNITLDRDGPDRIFTEVHRLASGHLPAHFLRCRLFEIGHTEKASSGNARCRTDNRLQGCGRDASVTDARGIFSRFCRKRHLKVGRQGPTRQLRPRSAALGKRIVPNNR